MVSQFPAHLLSFHEFRKGNVDGFIEEYITNLEKNGNVILVETPSFD